MQVQPQFNCNLVQIISFYESCLAAKIQYYLLGLTTSSSIIERMTINNGYVGIGTTSPDELLHLKSSLNLEPVLKIENSNTDNKNGNTINGNQQQRVDDDYVGQIDFME